MKKLFLLLGISVMCFTGSAQDIITKRNADEIKAKVLKITEQEIEYKKWENIDGPIYTIPAYEVFFIKYENGSKDIINALEQNPRTVRNAGPVQQESVPMRRIREPRAPRVASFAPRYQGEVSTGYAVGVSSGTNGFGNRLLFETVHGVRLNPYLFIGAGGGFAYFHKSLEVLDEYNNYIGEYKGAGVIPVFADFKSYCPFNEKLSLFLALDMGAAIPVSGYAKGGKTQFYVSVGPGVDFGREGGFPSGNFSVRFQHMGEKTNAILFRVGFGF